MRDLTRILGPEHEQKWVAFSKDYKKVVGFDDDLLNLKNKVGETSVIYRKIPPSGVYISC